MCLIRRANLYACNAWKIVRSPLKLCGTHLLVICSSISSLTPGAKYFEKSSVNENPQCSQTNTL